MISWRNVAYARGWNDLRLQMRPSLNGVVGRYSKEWIKKQICDSELDSPKAILPSASLKSREMDALVAYLTSMPAN